jgi:hypothetical protein
MTLGTYISGLYLEGSEQQLTIFTGHFITFFTFLQVKFDTTRYFVMTFEVWRC